MARFRDAGSLCAGILIGAAILVLVFAVLIADPGHWQLLWVFGALALLALGLGLQRAVTSTERRRRAAPPLCLAVPG
jgi:hypothetical protein